MKFFTNASEKRAFTQDLFRRLAPRYELVNIVMSMGQVGLWRRIVARQAQLPPGGRALDVATGAGALARAIARRSPGARVVGIDFAAAMVRVAQASTDQPAIDWAEGDALSLPFPDHTFDVVVNGFMLRNVVDVAATLAEQTRVARPGGRVLCLEMSWPTNPLFKPLFSLYFFGFAPLAGWLLTGHRDAYQYLPRSVKGFMSPEELAEAMRRVGLRDVTYRTFSFGTVTLHQGVKA
ncbi:MAG: ubiquinone/menaquinone biosynthesis methyltransferase [Anaerolineae bacterium]|nr:ubiquinone/menaquinone biosynthesis methyltransferase [Anaerolineae bacterium]